MDIIQFMKQFSNQKFILLGHSLGAGICTHIASIVPELVERLVLFDGLVTWPEPDAEFVNRSRLFVSQLPTLECKIRKYGTKEEAVEHRMKASKLSAKSALMLCERGLKSESDTFQWRWDERLLLPSPLRFTQAQLDAIVSSVQCPVLLLKASRQDVPRNEELMNLFEPHFKQLQVCQVEGGHYLHMESPSIAKGHIMKFLEPLFED